MALRRRIGQLRLDQPEEVHAEVCCSRSRAAAAAFVTSAVPAPDYSVLIRGGTIYDGSGSAPYVGDVAIKGDRIAYVGPHAPGRRRQKSTRTGKAVSPGFINMLSQAQESLIADGRGMSDTVQGVTLEVMGEGDSMGP